MSGTVLKLDEVFGLSNPVIVDWKGKRFEMLRPEGLTLEQNNRWHALSKKLVLNYGPTAKRVGKDGSTSDSVAELDQTMNELLKLLCPALLDEGKPLTLAEKIQRKFHPERFEEREPLTFSQKVKILEFYKQEVFEKKANESKVDGSRGLRHKPKNQIGA